MKKFYLVLTVFVLFAVVGIAIVHAKTATTSQTTTEVVNYVYVDVKGEVANPGVYRVSDKCRIFQVLEIAGGLSDNADTSSVNLAQRVSDEQIIKIPKENEELTVTSLININTATASELDTLPGIGYSTATNIIDYRTNNGVFKAKEEIKLVNGIGDVVYEQIKDLITI